MQCIALKINCALSRNLSDISKTTTIEKSSPLVHDNEIQDLDILCGRGKRCVQHHGNEVLRRIVGNYCEDYQKAKNRDAKFEVVTNIIKHLRRRGIRFLKQSGENSYFWHVLEEKESREKIAHTFRDFKAGKIKLMRVVPFNKRRKTSMHNSLKSSNKLKTSPTCVITKVDEVNTQALIPFHALVLSSASHKDMEASSLPPPSSFLFPNEQDTPLRPESAGDHTEFSLEVWNQLEKALCTEGEPCFNLQLPICYPLAPAAMETDSDSDSDNSSWISDDTSPFSLHHLSNDASLEDCGVFFEDLFED